MGVLILLILYKRNGEEGQNAFFIGRDQEPCQGETMRDLEGTTMSHYED